MTTPPDVVRTLASSTVLVNASKRVNRDLAGMLNVVEGGLARRWQRSAWFCRKAYLREREGTQEDICSLEARWRHFERECREQSDGLLDQDSFLSRQCGRLVRSVRCRVHSPHIPKQSCTFIRDIQLMMFQISCILLTEPQLQSLCSIKGYHKFNPILGLRWPSMQSSFPHCQPPSRQC